MKYFFTPAGVCKAIITENPQSNNPDLYLSGNDWRGSMSVYGSKLDGDIGRNPMNAINESGILRNKNTITLVNDGTNVTGAVKFHVSVVAYYPARILVNSVAYVLNNTSPLQVGGFAAGATVTVAPNGNYANGNTLSLTAYDPCSCSCCNG